MVPFKTRRSYLCPTPPRAALLSESLVWQDLFWSRCADTHVSVGDPAWFVFPVWADCRNPSLSRGSPLARGKE